MPDISTSTRTSTQAPRSRSASFSSFTTDTHRAGKNATRDARSAQPGLRQNLFGQDKLDKTDDRARTSGPKFAPQAAANDAAGGNAEASATAAAAQLPWSARIQQRCRSFMQRATAGLQSFVSSAAHALFHSMTLLQELGDFMVDFGKTLLKVTRSMPDLRAPTMTDDDIKRQR